VLPNGISLSEFDVRCISSDSVCVCVCVSVCVCVLCSLTIYRGLHFVVYYVDEDDAVTETWEYFDWFAPESNDYFFYRRAVRDLFNNTQLADGSMMHNGTKFTFWSDGGPKHFKIKKSVSFVLVELPGEFNGKFVTEWNWFALHHG